MFLCSKHSLKNLAMTLESCRVKKEDSVGAGPQNMFVLLSHLDRFGESQFLDFGRVVGSGITVNFSVSAI